MGPWIFSETIMQPDRQKCHVYCLPRSPLLAFQPVVGNTHYTLVERAALTSQKSSGARGTTSWVGLVYVRSALLCYRSSQLWCKTELKNKLNNKLHIQLYNEADIVSLNSRLLLTCGWLVLGHDHQRQRGVITAGEPGRWLGNVLKIISAD